MGADIRARQAREDAHKGAREADRAETYAWSLRMEDYGRARPAVSDKSQCLNGGLGWLEVEVQSLQDPGESARRHPPAARHACMEA
jgi:hypothetical protein